MLRNRQFFPIVLILATCLPNLACDRNQPLSATLPQPGPITDNPYPGDPGNPGNPGNPGTPPPVTGGSTSMIYGKLQMPNEITRADVPLDPNEESFAANGGASNAEFAPPQTILPDSFIIKFKDQEGFSSFKKMDVMAALPSDAKHSERLQSCGATLASAYRLQQLEDESDEQLIQRYAQRMEFMRQQLADEGAEIIPNYRYYKLSHATDDVRGTVDPSANDKEQWHYPAVRIEEAWKITKGKSNKPIIVAVIDTGVKTKHPDLPSDMFVGGYDFISDVASANDGDGPDDNADDPGDSKTSAPSSFHGTHVAGTVAARLGSRGVVGVAPEVLIMPLRVLGVKGGDSFDIATAIRYAAGLTNATGVKPRDKQGNFIKADIINMSFGGGGNSPIIEAAIQAAVEQGVIPIAAAGNNGNNIKVYPAVYPQVIAIGALGRVASGGNFPRPDGFPYAMRITSYSNFGPNIDIMAPGGITEPYTKEGVFSTLWRIEKDPFTDETTGIPDYRFYQGTSMAAPHVAGIAALMKAVNRDLTLNGVRSLLYDTAVPGKSIDPNASASRYANGMVNAEAAVRAAKALAELTAASPTLHVIAVDKETQAVILSTHSTSSDNFSFSFNKVPAGRYILKAGTDKDNDGLMCEQDDLCGATKDELNLTGNNSVEGVNIPLSMLTSDSQAVRFSSADAVTKGH